MATVKNIIEQAYTKVNGEYEALLETSDDFKTYLNVLNQSIETWATQPHVKWQSLFDYEYVAGTVSEGTLQYDLDDFDRIVIANTPLDNIFFVDEDNQIVDSFKLVNQASFQSRNSVNVAAILGDILHLKNTTDTILDTTIKLPVYMKPGLYTSGDEEVLVDSVTWLVTYMAAFISSASPVPFIARNADKYYKQAETFMKTMKLNNNHSQKLVIKRAGAAPESISYLSFIERIRML